MGLVVIRGHSLWRVERRRRVSRLSGHSWSFVVEGRVDWMIEWGEWSFVVDGGVVLVG